MPGLQHKSGNFWMKFIFMDRTNKRDNSSLLISNCQSRIDLFGKLLKLTKNMAGFFLFGFSNVQTI
jgi:hypothetical protein